MAVQTGKTRDCCQETCLEATNVQYRLSGCRMTTLSSLKSLVLPAQSTVFGHPDERKLLFRSLVYSPGSPGHAGLPGRAQVRDLRPGVYPVHPDDPAVLLMCHQKYQVIWLSCCNCCLLLFWMVRGCSNPTPTKNLGSWQRL